MRDFIPIECVQSINATPHAKILDMGIHSVNLFTLLEGGKGSLQNCDGSPVNKMERPLPLALQGFVHLGKTILKRAVYSRNWAYLEELEFRCWIYLNPFFSSSGTFHYKPFWVCSC